MATRSLRGRLTWTFAVGAAVLSTVFASLTYFGVRHIIVVSRQASDLQQAYVNAALVRSAVAQDSASLPSLLTSLDAATTSSSLVQLGSTWIEGTSVADPTSIPAAFRVAGTEVVRQVVIEHNVPVLIIAVPLPAVRATYFQRRELADLNGTLNRLLGVLALGTLFTSGLGAYAGRRTTRRAIAPLADTAQAARQVAEGDLTVRLPANAPHSEVATLSAAFNEMVEQLVLRLERDARFASDVSHELRSPLTTLAMSAEVLRLHEAELHPDAREALALLTMDVATFQSLVEDLLDIAKADAGTDTMVEEVLPIGELVTQCVISATRRHQLPATALDSQLDGEHYVSVDRRRFERVITNLLENAYRYGDDRVVVTLALGDGGVQLTVDDNGPGIAPAERERVFERFYRGAGASRRGDARGTGLGLALVAEHVSRFAGRVEVAESPLGGCRMIVWLPAVEGERE
ncbi:MAG: HAMP domain-containing sensor histidine kinase [Actinobacteria bacterium]|nr:HAMP domain-containing sensor histidine kinase [Actinomycetota bacterium]